MDLEEICTTLGHTQREMIVAVTFSGSLNYCLTICLELVCIHLDMHRDQRSAALWPVSGNLPGNCYIA